MNVLARKSLLLVVAAAHVVVGAGAGERVVYFGTAHVGHHHEGCDHRGHRHATELHFLPISTPAPAGHDRHHEHDCPHVHVRGEDAPRAAAGARVAAPAVVAAPAPPFLSVAVARAGGLRRAADTDAGATPAPHPPDAALVRLTL